jgi:hypothetical protein
VGVVIEDPELKVVRASYEPIFARYKLGTAYRNFGDLECFNERACLVIVDIDCAIVKASQ